LPRRELTELSVIHNFAHLPHGRIIRLCSRRFDAGHDTNGALDVTESVVADLFASVDLYGNEATDLGGLFGIAGQLTSNREERLILTERSLVLSGE
jgi:hypothetical protein